LAKRARGRITVHRGKGYQRTGYGPWRALYTGYTTAATGLPAGSTLYGTR